MTQASPPQLCTMLTSTRGRYYDPSISSTAPHCADIYRRTYINNAEERTVWKLHFISHWLQFSVEGVQVLQLSIQKNKSIFVMARPHRVVILTVYNECRNRSGKSELPE
uniref:Uncharacterized protein n=1 Tax=Timema bartmani TaxID=61472 RepID=A0A7R9F3A4_9NEOP|nr:unnamed protein product [Timema bartmani]